MPTSNQGLMELCLWREARGEGNAGMTAVACVIRNRVARRHSCYAIEVMRPWQFTSMTDTHDPEYKLFAAPGDASWGAAQGITEQVIAGMTADVTGGATLYWNPAGISSDKTFTLASGAVVKFPATWNAAKVHESCVIGRHIFLTEV